jgi:hypothetical protein
MRTPTYKYSLIFSLVFFFSIACRLVQNFLNAPESVPNLPAGITTPTAQHNPSPTPPLPIPSPTSAPSPTPIPPIPCAELSKLWTSGLAFPRSDGDGYDVSACLHSRPAGFVEMVKPGEREPNRWEAARCNDGTPFGFALELSPSAKSQDWVVFLKGGGFCDDNAIPCTTRSSKLVTTPQEKDGEIFSLSDNGIFNRDSVKNPLFFDANYAVAEYCSSDLWSGASSLRRPTLADPNGWYFSGKLNVRAMLEILIERYGLEDANPQTHILFAGSSAGGAGVDANAATIAYLFPQIAQTGRLKLLNDAGFIIDFNYPPYFPGETQEPIFRVLMKAYNFWGSAHNPLCEAAQVLQGQQPGRCFLSSVGYPFVTQPPSNGLGLPYLIQYSSIDEYAIHLHGIDDLNNAADIAALQQWRITALDELKDVQWLFSGGHKPYHALLTNNDMIDYGPPGNTFIELLTRFWQGGQPERVIFGNP